MLTAHHISKKYLLDPILRDISFSISTSERVGLIGPNGCGKTTLLNILAGRELPDEGNVVATIPDLRIGFLQQGYEPDASLTMRALLNRVVETPDDLAMKVDQLAKLLAQDVHNPDLQTAYDQALSDLQHASERTPPEAILAAFRIDEIKPEQPVRILSGGQKTRVALALLLLSDPNLLLLDEPTNHLDIQMLEWLEEWLRRFPGAALIVSHDRTFLDHTVNRILELNANTHGIREYQGNYSDYFEQYLAGRELQWAEYRDQVYEIRRMRQDIERTKEQAKQVELSTTSRQPGVRRIAKKVAKKAKSRERKLVRYLKSDERVEKPKESWQMKLEFDHSPRLGQKVLSVEGLAVGYAGNPPLMADMYFEILAGMRIALTGPNGCGKTTLLRTLAGTLEPVAGKVRLGGSVHLGYMSQEQELLDEDKTALQIIQGVAAMNDTEARSFLHYYLFTGDDPVRLISSLSYGERARLALAILVAQGSNLLFLDEPINHLDIPSRARFEQALENYNGAVLAVVHDRYFIQHFASDVWQISNGQLSFG